MPVLEWLLLWLGILEGAARDLAIAEYQRGFCRVGFAMRSGYAKYVASALVFWLSSCRSRLNTSLNRSPPHFQRTPEAS
jgi:hypothetical protein